jgi:stage III sporulation protein AH
VKSDSSAVADATARSNQIASNIEAESNMESLIRAKGFADCVVVMGEGNVSVVVKTDGLLASDTVQIQEILEQNSGFSLENIKIIEVK